MKEIRVGLVGLGPRGRGCWAKHFGQMEGYKLVAVCDRFDESVKKTMRNLNDPNVSSFRDFSTMLKEASPDAVGICSDPDKQVDLAVEALEAGVHVMTEVPAAFTIEDLWRLVAAVEKTGLIYQLGEQTRHWGFVDAWKSIVSSGTLGRIVCAEGQYIGYYGAHWFFYDAETGRYLSLDEARSNPRARPTWRNGMHQSGICRTNSARC
ncbi:MAG: Gfo/Idh/MocA family oxidoreductase [Planctomycetota bacterium]|nr:Gfo/Idh/MocA family oxidoreductase [Planctomycetota bacterium]